MIDVKEKLVELQSIVTCPNAICNFCAHFKNKNACEKHKKEVIAENMISNGVTILPCRVGDMLYTILIRGIDDYFIRESVVSKIEICEDFGIKIIERRKDTSGAYFYYKIDIDQIGETIFFTKEEAQTHIPNRHLEDKTNEKRLEP